MFALYLFGTVFVTAFGVFTVALMITQKKRQMRAAIEKQRLAYEYETGLLKSNIEAREETMSQVAEDIHDGIGQVLSISQMQLSELAAYIPSKEGQEILNTGLATLRHSISELRATTHSLHTRIASGTALEESIEMEIRRLSNRHLKSKYEIFGTPVSIDPERALPIFRTVQEALQNVIRHAAATQVDVCVEFLVDELVVKIRDNGKGFDLKTIRSNNSLGISNMMKRAEAVGGKIYFEPIAAGGTEVRLAVPIKPVGAHD